MQGTIIKRDLTKPLCCIGYLLAISCLFCAVTARAAPHSLNFTQWDQTTHNGSWLINPAGTTAHGVQHLGEVDYHAAAILRKQFHAVDFANELPGTLRFDYSLVIDGPAVTGFAHLLVRFSNDLQQAFEPWVVDMSQAGNESIDLTPFYPQGVGQPEWIELTFASILGTTSDPVPPFASRASSLVLMNAEFDNFNPVPIPPAGLMLLSALGLVRFWKRQSA